jgi:6,7-dimethyl-8-ribityllumazine synthase
MVSSAAGVLPGAAASSRALILAFHLCRETMNQISSSVHQTLSDVDRDRPLRVAVIASSWHSEIVGQATQSLVGEFARSATPPEVEHFAVPGAFEIPLLAKKLAKTGRYDAIVACGLVVNGGIYRHEFVGAAVIDALMRVQLDTEVPVLSAVLTPRDFHEHEDHHRFFSEHFVKKGVEVARACLAAIAVLRAAECLGA